MERGVMLKPFRSQSESFRAFKDDGMYYVDKTSFIPYLINMGDKICVVTRPRRFGKTLMLRTLQTFFEYRLGSDGEPIDNRPYFDGLAVMAAGTKVLAEMGQYPVISLSFKDVSGETYETIVSMLNDAVRRACVTTGQMLMSSGKLSHTHREWLQTFIDGNASPDNLAKYLALYTQWLYDVTNRKTVILLDEYDVPLQKAAIYDNRHPGTDLFEQTVQIIGQFISSGFKSNNNLAYGIIAGCMRVAKESIFTGMNNLGVITVIDNIPDEYWGFTEPEVRKMLKYYDLEDQYEEIEHWYDGYEYSHRKVFNPWSLLNAVRGFVNGDGDRAIQSYWARTSGNDIIEEMITSNPSHRHTLARIMEGEPFWAQVFQDLSYRDLKKRPEAIWSFLLFTGYLKSIKLRQLDTGNWEALLTIPNMEIRSVMNQAMQHWWRDIKLSGYNAQPLMEALLSGDIARIIGETCAIMDDSISVNDAKEDFYHGMLVGVLRTLCRVKSNREYGEGRPDIVAYMGNSAIILELKCLLPSVVNKYTLEQQFKKVPKMMNELLDEAETQIRSRYYIEGLMFEEPNIAEVKAYAMCFCKKRCAVREVERR